MGKADAETHFPATVAGALAQCWCRAERLAGRGVDSEGLVEWARSARTRVERCMGMDCWGDVSGGSVGLG